MGHLDLADNAYLKRRRGKRRSGYRWYVRVSVPADLRDTLHAKTVERALNTSDYKEAQRLRHGVLAEIFADFERARRHTITSADIEHEAQRFLRERFDLIQTKPGDAFEELMDALGNSLGTGGDAILEMLRDGLADEDWSPAVVSEVDRITRRYGTILTPHQHRELSHSLQKAEIEALARALAIHEGAAPEPIAVLNACAVDPITAALKSRSRLSPKDGNGIRVKEAAEDYIADRNRQRRGAWTGQTLKQARGTFKLFENFTRNAPLSSITRGDIASFLGTLARLNPDYGRKSSQDDFSLNDLLRTFEAKPGHGLSNKTLNRHTATIAGMFDWALRNGKLDGSNPATGHRRTSDSHNDIEPSARRSFTAAELKKLFSGELFAISYAERVRPTRHTAETALTWLIPIALFSGMRLDEICGLRVADVTAEGGISYFDLLSHEGRRLKTVAARRRIPIHSELSRIGLMEYVANITREKHQYLFPGLKPGGPDDKRSWYISKRFTVYRRSVGVRDPGTVFHCFRKNVATALERARVPENEAVQILGHKKMTMSYGLYSGGLDLGGLRRVVEAIAYSGLDLSNLEG